MNKAYERETEMWNQVFKAVSYTHLRAHETDSYLVCRLLLEKKKNKEIYDVNCIKRR